MTSRLRQWLVFFFTRPIRVSDLSALASRMKLRPEAGPSPMPPSAELIEVQTTIPAPVRERQAARVDARRPVIPSMFRPQLEIGVSEQPLDTLPADLRDELQRPSTGRLGGSGLHDG